MGVSISNVVHFTMKPQEDRSFSMPNKSAQETFSRWLQQDSSFASETKVNNIGRHDSHKGVPSNRVSKAIGQTKKTISEKDIKQMMKKLDSVSDNVAEEIDLEALFERLTDDQLKKLMALLNQGDSEKMFVFEELIEVFQKMDIAGGWSDSESFEKVVELISGSLEELKDALNQISLESELNEFIHALTKSLQQIQDRLDADESGKEKIFNQLTCDNVQQIKSLKEDGDKGKPLREVSESHQNDGEGKTTKISKELNLDPEMKEGKEQGGSQEKDGFISMAEQKLVQTENKLDNEITIPFQEIEALLEKNHQLVEDVKTEKTEIQNRMMDELVTKISMLHDKGESRLEMQLIPEHLGKLTVQLTSQDGNMTARIFAETAYARDMIENNFGQLKDALAGKGINVLGLEVFVGKDPEAYEKQREFQYEMAKGKRKRGISSEGESSGQMIGKINPSDISHNPYISSEGFDRLG